MSHGSKESEEKKPDLEEMSDKKKLINKEDGDEEEPSSKNEVSEKASGAEEQKGEKHDSDGKSDKDKFIDTEGRKETKLSPKNKDEESSDSESLDKKPSSEAASQENVETSSEATSSKTSKTVNGQSDKDEESSSNESLSSEDMSDVQEQKDEQEEFKKKQEVILGNIIVRENDLANLPHLRPCNSCEFLPDPKDSESSSCCWGRIPNRFGGKKIREFWIVCAPADPTPQDTFDKLNEATSLKKMSHNYKLHIPDFRIGTLNEMIYVSGSLSSLDVDAARIVENLVDFMRTVIQGDLRVFLEDNNLDVINYITKFTWNSVLYPNTKPLNVLKDVIRSQLRNMEENLKMRSEEYGSLDKTLQNIEKNKTGSLYTRSLADIVKKEDFVLDSNFLTTLLVVVPHQKDKDWQKCYPKMAKMVVPDSSSLLFSDKQHSLYSVVLGKKFVDEFKTNASEKRFMVRDFEYCEEVIKEEHEIQNNVENLRKEQMEVLTRWIKVRFSETFAAWMHVKVMRCFVESVLKFGIENEFQPMMLLPLKTKALKKKLEKLYDGVDNDLVVREMKDVPGGLATIGGQLENTKYVYLKIPIHCISKKE